MKHNTNKLRSAWLAATAALLAGTVAFADELPVRDLFPLNTRIVIAQLTVPVDRGSRQASLDGARDLAVAKAVAAVKADNKLELDLRLSGHESSLLVADL